MTNYVQEIEDRINTGATRVKKRTKSVDKTTGQKCKVSIPGVFVDLNVYKQDFGDPAEREHKVCDIIDPETGKMKKAAFIPKRKAGYFEGELATTQKLQKKEVLDCDLNALRSGQVDESFDQHMESFAKSAPKVLPDAETFEQCTQPRIEVNDHEED